MIVALARSLKNRFPAAKAPCAAVLCCLALAACDSEPLFDASSVPAYQKSLDAINARLNLQDRNRLKIALVTLAAGGTAEFTRAGLPRVPANIAALESVANPTPLLDRMRPTIEGKTAAAVIAIAPGPVPIISLVLDHDLGQRFVGIGFAQVAFGPRDLGIDIGNHALGDWRALPKLQSRLATGHAAASDHLHCQRRVGRHRAQACL